MHRTTIIELASGERSREKLVALARSARGMWADRDPDNYLAASRIGLIERDEEKELIAVEFYRRE